jgi:hypothetical protein
MRFKLVFLSSLVVSVLLFQCRRGAEREVYRLYFLGGQSNMDGYGFISELPEGLNTTVSGVWIFHGNSASDGGEVDGRGLWTALCPGHGVGFQSDGIVNTYSL